MDNLRNIGFQKVGQWRSQEGQLVLVLDSMEGSRNVLYAFTVDGELKYVGKTVQPLRQRLNGYLRPDPSQSTNVRNRAAICAALCEGRAVEIYALPDAGLIRYGDFHLNVAAGLEDSLIASLKPEWNGRRRLPGEVRSAPSRSSVPQVAPVLAPVPPPSTPSSPRGDWDVANLLAQRIGRTYKTLGQGKPFDLVAVHPTSILVRPVSTETIRSIRMKEISGALTELLEKGSISLQGIRRHCEMNPVYLAALFADLPGVTASGRPIQLRFSGPTAGP